MFPEAFAHDNIEKWTGPGDLVLDPFSGRGTTLFEALLMGRNAIASDINLLLMESCHGDRNRSQASDH